MRSRLSIAALAAAVSLLSGCATTGLSASNTAGTSIAPIEVPKIERPTGETPQWWFTQGASTAAAHGAMRGKAKNVILFVGDGMSLPTVAAARIFLGQQTGHPGEETRLSWEDFPNTALSRTYNTNAQTPDSAGTMTAMATGIKTRMGMLSVGQAAERADCGASLQTQIPTLWEMAADAGLATGVVTTTAVTHATPGATFAHVPERNWENDTDLTPEATEQGCLDIASQMVGSPYGKGPDVLMGGGRMNFFGVDQNDPEYDDKVGQRLDGRNLVDEWKARHPGGTYVWNLEQFNAAPKGTPIIGLFEPSHMQFEQDRPKDPAGEPSLAQMTESAIQRLSALNPDGFVLLVEGGRIDHAHHGGNAYRALKDTVALHQAVERAAQITNPDDTLILVTADHSHTMFFVGYPARGNPILGKVRGGSGEAMDPRALAMDATGLPFTTLGYANGPGYAGATSTQEEGPKRNPHYPSGFQQAENGRPNLTDVDTEHPDYLQEAMVPTSSESHGGDDVGIWARGTGSDAIRGNVEQNTIFHFLLQSNPKLRAYYCSRNLCNAQGVPVKLPEPKVVRRAQ